MIAAFCKFDNKKIRKKEKKMFRYKSGFAGVSFQKQCQVHVKLKVKKNTSVKFHVLT